MGLPPHFTRPVPVTILAPADSPRLSGIDEAHARQLAEVYALLPPILVHRPTMRVIDGMHRVRAAIISGLDVIDAQFFDGDENEAFIQSVARNIAHGLPLSLADRKAAARRILAAFPAMPDRSVALYTGLDTKTVAEARRSAAPDSPPRAGTTGDGQARPPHPAPGHRAPTGATAHRPEPPPGAVAQEPGLSPVTVHDVRRHRGEEPVPANRAGASFPQAPGLPDPVPTRGNTPGTGRRPARRVLRRPARPQASRSSPDLLRSLAADPSLRNSEAGRTFLRWLHSHFFTDEAWRRQIEAVPPHCTDAVAEIALKCSDIWLRFAQELSDRRNSVPAVARRSHD
nr:ParB N-terminal domain-containing protein [Streptomyces sp. NBC_01754]